MIKYLTNKEINKEKWDESIRQAYNGIIYAQAWYLDIVAPGWSALVQNNYEAIMPLPVKKKFGISYAYIPYFTQQLGIFAKDEKSVNLGGFLKAIPSKIKFLEQKLNEENKVSQEVGYQLNNNYLIDISSNYDTVKTHYNRNCKRNLKKAEKMGFEVNNEMPPKEFSNFVFDNLKDELASDTQEERNLLATLAEEVQKRNKGEIVALKEMYDDIVYAAGFFMFSKDRLIFSVCASSEFGKENQAMYQLVDSQIKKHSGKFKCYDFSGSNQKGIAYFNSTFGAKPVSYPTIKINRLPWPIKKFKK